MAERLDSLPPARASRRIYPWEKWTDGSVWQVRQGEDFDVAPESMAAMVRLRAKAEGLTASARVNGEVVAFQFSEPEDEAA